MKFTILMLSLVCSLVMCGQKKQTKGWQIKTAVLAAPEKFRENAMVYGYDDYGKLTVLRPGTNQYICLADDPNQEGFQAAAYHKDLDAFMERGRELKAQGKTFEERFDIREEEVKSGKLKMPDKTTLFVLHGTINDETSEIDDQYLRYVVYIPYATEESTGLPASALGKGHPWIMDPGTHRAHIMISPPKN
ncbi:MAG: hypothetical protein ABJG78_17255 [Cyclobacteriaceae bacterium]